jgi:hypothetical protein
MTIPYNRADEVFGIVRGKPLNYVTRAKVDALFYESLTRNKHIVVHGSSKQGKTSLRKTWLGEKDYLHVGCLNTMGLAELHSAILKKAGFRVEQSAVKTTGGVNKYNVEIGGKGGIPFITEASAKGAYERQNSSTEAITVKRLEVDLTDVNDIIASLTTAESPQYIVLEDFHYLPIETQIAFSMALKLFHEESRYCFIVIGVWRERNRLVYFNGDLASRVVAIDADEWSNAELTKVVETGGTLLNVTFDPKFLVDVVQNAQSAVYLVQEACLKALGAAGIEATQDRHIIVGAGVDAKALIKEVVDEQAGRYTTFIQGVSEGFQITSLEMYKYLLHAILRFTAEALSTGLRRAEIAAAIKDFHPDGESLNEGNITQALTNLASLQVKKGVRPIVLDYDQTNRVLNVVDRAFLIWLGYQDRKTILADIVQ